MRLIKTLYAALPALRPRCPSSVRSVVTYVLDAAAVERRVAIGLGMSIMAFLGWTGLWLFLALATWQGIIIFIIYVTFLTCVVSFGLSAPIFIIIAWGRLWIRWWGLVGQGIVEKWVHPATRIDMHPAFIWKLWGQKIIVEVLEYDTENGEFHEVRRSMPQRRRYPMYNPVQIYNAIHKERIREHFSPVRTRMGERINQGLMVLLILGVTFWGVALATSDGGVK